MGQDLDTQVRLDGVDAPELKGKCPYENCLAIKARNFILSLASGGKVSLQDIQYGKYAGCVVAWVLSPGGEDFSDALLRTGLGRGYHGRRRKSWCQVPAP